jgi:hypothetical protein
VIPPIDWPWLSVNVPFTVDGAIRSLVTFLIVRLEVGGRANDVDLALCSASDFAMTVVR